MQLKTRRKAAKGKAGSAARRDACRRGRSNDQRHSARQEPEASEMRCGLWWTFMAEGKRLKTGIFGGSRPDAE